MTDIGVDPAAEQVEEPVAADPAPEADPFESGAEQFPRAYVEKLRKENETQRSTWKAYEETFGRFHPDDRQVLLQLAQTLARDPGEAARQMRAIAEHLSPAQAAQMRRDVAEAAGQNGNGEQPGDKPLTQAELDKWWHEKETAQQVDSIRERMSAAGVEFGTPEATALLQSARDRFDGDLEKAIEAGAEAKKTDREKIIAEYLAEKNPANRPRPAAVGGTPSGAQPGPKTMKDAHRSAAERIAAVFDK